MKPDPRNLRKHSRKQILQLARCIKAVGFNSPVLIDRGSNVICGHARLLACRELGLKEIATICLDHLDEGQLRAFMIADNRLAEIATWDDRVLAEHLRDLSLLDLDFGLELTGFEMGEIDLRIASLEGQPTAEDPADGEVDPAAASVISKPGDLWLLGEHRVLSGSILDIPSLQRLMG